MNLSGVERAILRHLLLRGDDRPINIAESEGVHRVSVSRSMPDLVEEGLVIGKGNGVYRLSNDGLIVARNITDSTDRES